MYILNFCVETRLSWKQHDAKWTGFWAEIWPECVLVRFCEIHLFGLVFLFSHSNLMGAEASGKVSWPIAGEHNCTNWHVTFYNMSTKCTFAYTAVQRKNVTISQNKGFLWLSWSVWKFAFEGQYNSLALHFLHVLMITRYSKLRNGGLLYSG